MDDEPQGRYASTGGLGVADIAELLESASAVAASDASLVTPLQWAVDHVCSFTDWPVGHIHLVQDGPEAHDPMDVWHLDDPRRFATFVHVTETAGSASAGVRGVEAAACGLVWSASFPIPSSTGADGVMEFFSDTTVDPGSGSVEVVSQMGRLLGHVRDEVRSRQALARSESRMAEAQRLAHLGSWSWRVDADRVAWSDELYRIYGLAPDDAPVGLDTYLSQIHALDRDRVAAAVRTTLRTGDPYEHECRLVRPDGEIRWVAARGRVLEWSDGAPSRLGGYCHDITARKSAEARSTELEADLVNQELILEKIARGEPVESTLDSLCHLFESRYPQARCSVLHLDDESGVLRHIAAPSLPDSFRRAIDGLAVAEGMGACGTAAAREELVIVEDTMADPLVASFQELARNHRLRSVWSLPLQDRQGAVTGTFAVYWPRTHRPDDEEVRSLRAAGSLAAIAIDRKRSEQAASAAARLDPLTGLPNRAQFLDLLERRLADPAAKVAVLYCDLDRFKGINDSLGHPAGDRILVEVAERLCAVVSRAVLSRFGGDEFSVLMSEATPAAVTAVAERIGAVFDRPFVLESGEFYLSVSTGIALNDHGADATGLVRDADAAMYAAKEGGRARHAMFDEHLRRRAHARLTLESDLRRAIDRNEFLLHYQPVLDLRSNTWGAVEALVRWNHPTRGLLDPDQFIPLAEETRLIVPLGLQVLTMAATQAARLIACGVPLPVAVNISAMQLADPQIDNEVTAVRAERGVPASALVLEVTESAVMAQFDVAQAALGRIVKGGVAVVIDDFGTGYSSIARLGDLPVSGVKIDRQFTMRLGDDVDAGRVFGAITDLAHALELSVVAEGIETAEALEMVRTLGCESGQGHHLSRPVPADRLLDLVRRSRRTRDAVPSE